ncbi:hypothetical protein [Vibrio hippocampi]|uniref:Uncharacterized protein n=1 Tax=Vibrio hippocampi TaxID=654686 RepID=A0ABN8DDD4_9VIBR|nr:hypothetical protein [Vibrio hippocampi]CAH0524548.1 hypothetical protein VHP8226_00386 [Vibrio hippocampi]
MIEAHRKTSPLYLKSIKAQLGSIAMVAAMVALLMFLLVFNPILGELSESQERYVFLQQQVANSTNLNTVAPNLNQEQQRLESLFVQWQPKVDQGLLQADVLSSLRQHANDHGLQLHQAAWHETKPLATSRRLTLELRGEFYPLLEFAKSSVSLGYLLLPISLKLSNTSSDLAQIHLSLDLFVDGQSGRPLMIAQTAKAQLEQWLRQMPLTAKKPISSEIESRFANAVDSELAVCAGSGELSLPSFVGRFTDRKQVWAVVHFSDSGLRFVSQGERFENWLITEISTDYLVVKKEAVKDCRIPRRGKWQ